MRPNFVFHGAVGGELRRPLLLLRDRAWLR